MKSILFLLLSGLLWGKDAGLDILLKSRGKLPLVTKAKEPGIEGEYARIFERKVEKKPRSTFAVLSPLSFYFHPKVLEQYLYEEGIFLSGPRSEYVTSGFYGNWQDWIKNQPQSPELDQAGLELARRNSIVPSPQGQKLRQEMDQEIRSIVQELQKERGYLQIFSTPICWKSHPSEHLFQSLLAPQADDISLEVLTRIYSKNNWDQKKATQILKDLSTRLCGSN